MQSIFTTIPPKNALINIYRGKPGCYTDCYAADIDGFVDFIDFVTAFYTTWLFKLERIVLKLAVQRPSTDRQARQVASGQTGAFAAWTVEHRAEDQLLMCDMAGRTRSWFMAVSATADGQTTTRLYFGSAVVPLPGPDAGNRNISVCYAALLGFHRFYSRALLATAAARLKNTTARR